LALPANNANRTYPAPNYSRAGLDVYPHPYFDPSNWYMPTTMKEMFRWCLFLYLTNSTIGPVIRKKASYILTDLVYSTTSERVKSVWKSLLENTLKLKEFEFVMLIDFEVFGNSFASIIYPFDRYLICPRCDFQNPIKAVKWQYDGNGFVATCKNCKTTATMKVKDKAVRNRKRIRLHRWFPQYMELKKNPVTGRVKYLLRLPGWMKGKISNPKVNKIYVEDTPMEFLEAIRDNKIIELDTDNIFHMKAESVSMEDDSFGVPQILNVIKDAWLHQTFKKAQEAIALEHVLPLTLVSPMPSPGTPSPHMGTDLATWRGKMQGIFSQWRRDPNALFPVPFPVQISQVRGDAQALSVHNDINMVRQQIAGGLDVPPDFLYGNLTWSGGNVTLRVLENLLINRLSGVNNMLSGWIIPRMRRFLILPHCEIRHKDFKMADDIQQKNIALQLRASNSVSDQTVLEELGFDVSKEDRIKERELGKRLTDMRRQQISQANTEAEVSIIRAKNEVEIARIRRVAAEEDMAAQQAQGIVPGAQGAPQPGQEAPQGQPGAQQASQPLQIPTGGPQGSPMNVMPPEAGGNGMAPRPPSPMALQNMVEMFLKSTPVHERDYQLNIIADTDPFLARAIKQQLKTMDMGQRHMMPLPDQKPPRRGADAASI